MQKQYPIHFVGKDYYTQTSFSREATVKGVQRAVSFGNLKGLKFGDRILLANFIPSAKPDERKKKIGSAQIFGYFTLTGISHTLPPEYKEALLEKLDVIQNNTEAKSTLRACGSYICGGNATITNTLAEVLTAITETLSKTVHDKDLIEETLRMHLCNCKRCGIDKKDSEHEVYECIKSKCKCCTKRQWLLDPNRVKWFMVGPFIQIQPLTVTPITFTRGISKADLAIKFPKRKPDSRSIQWLSKYEKRAYMPSYLKEDFGAKPNPQFEKYFGTSLNRKPTTEAKE